MIGARSCTTVPRRAATVPIRLSTWVSLRHSPISRIPAACDSTHSDPSGLHITSVTSGSPSAANVEAPSSRQSLAYSRCCSSGCAALIRRLRLRGSPRPGSAEESASIDRPYGPRHGAHLRPREWPEVPTVPAIRHACTHKPELMRGDYVPSPDRVWQRQAEAIDVGRHTARKALTVDDHRLRPDLHHVAGDGDHGLDDGLHAADTRTRPEVAPSRPDGRCLETHAGRHPRAPYWGPRDGAVESAWRTRGEIHVQAEAQDRGKQRARDRHADDSPSDRLELHRCAVSS